MKILVKSILFELMSLNLIVEVTLLPTYLLRSRNPFFKKQSIRIILSINVRANRYGRKYNTDTVDTLRI